MSVLSPGDGWWWEAKVEVSSPSVCLYATSLQRLGRSLRSARSEINRLQISDIGTEHCESATTDSTHGRLKDSGNIVIALSQSEGHAFTPWANLRVPSWRTMVWSRSRDSHDARRILLIAAHRYYDPNPRYWPTFPDITTAGSRVLCQSRVIQLGETRVYWAESAQHWLHHDGPKDDQAASPVTVRIGCTWIVVVNTVNCPCLLLLW